MGDEGEKSRYEFRASHFGAAFQESRIATWLIREGLGGFEFTAIQVIFQHAQRPGVRFSQVNSGHRLLNLRSAPATLAMETDGEGVGFAEVKLKLKGLPLSQRLSSGHTHALLGKLHGATMAHS